MNETINKTNILNPERWGLHYEVVDEIGEDFNVFFDGFHSCFTTKTWNNSEYGKIYIKGLMTMEKKWNYANISRHIIDARDDGSNIQHFMSDSPWSVLAVFDKIQQQIRENTDLQDGILSIDESADEKSGDKSAGAGKQYNGRLGKKVKRRMYCCSPGM